jgi:hypothetical protein
MLTKLFYAFRTGFNKTGLIVAGLFLCLLSSTNAQLSIVTSGAAVTQNFNSIGSTAAASLPSGFRVSNTGNYTLGTSVTTVAAGTSGTGVLTGTSTGGTYNFANGVTATSTDRSIGFISTGSFTSPREIMLQVQNNTGSTITDLAISWNYEKYRSGSRAFDWTFFTGTNGTTWSPVLSGNQSYAADPNNTVISNPPLSINKSINVTGLSVPNGGFYYLRWVYTGVGGSTNAQGLGIDDFSITSTTPTPAISISSIPNFSTISGQTAPIQTYTVSGANLTNNITLQPFNANFEISTDGNNFTTGVIVLPQSGGVVNSTLIYVRMVPTSVGTFTGQISHNSVGAVNQILNLTGNVVPSTWYSVASGNINAGTVWSSTPTGSPDPIAYSKFRNDVSLVIQTGTTVLLPSSLAATPVKNLTIESGGKLWRNSNLTGNMIYLNIFGNIVNNGEIGNGTTFDACGFQIEGNCQFSGTGIHNLGRVRKNTNTPNSSLTIMTDSVNIRFPGLALYNNFDNTTIDVIVPNGKKLLLPNGEFSTNGTNGTGNTAIMNLTVSGTFVANGVGTSYGINLNPSSVPALPVDNLISSNIIINSAGKVTIKNFDIRQTPVMNLTINTGGTLTITGFMRVFAGTINSNGGIVIENGANLFSGTGFTYPFSPSGGTITGNVKVKKQGDFAFTNYNFWSSPITNSTLQPLILGGALAGSALNIYQYNPIIATTQVNSGWMNLPGSTLMTPGKGYTATAAGNVVFNGPVNQSTINIPLQQGPNSNFNLIGNPYPSTLSVPQFLTTNSLSAVYLWDDDASAGSDYQSNDYIVVNSLGTVSGSSTTPSPSVTGISSCQGFFIESSNPSVTFNNTMRIGGQAQFFENLQRVYLKLNNNFGTSTETLLAFVQDATMNRDLQYDAITFGQNQDFDLWSVSQDNFDLAIQAVPYLTSEISIPLGVNCTLIGTQSIELATIENIDETVLFILEDTQLGVFHSLRQGPYVWENNQVTLGTSRFILHIKPAVSVIPTSTTCTGQDATVTLIGNPSWSFTINEQSGQIEDTVIVIISQPGLYNLNLINGTYIVNKTLNIETPEIVQTQITTNVSTLFVDEQIEIFNITTGADSIFFDYGDGSPITTNELYQYAQAGVYTCRIIARNQDCEAQDQIVLNVIDFPASITENIEERQLLIYPNPNDGVLNIMSDRVERVKIYNTVGQLLKDEVVNKNMIIDDLDSGVYFVVIGNQRFRMFMN